MFAVSKLSILFNSALTFCNDLLLTLSKYASVSVLFFESACNSCASSVLTCLSCASISSAFNFVFSVSGLIGIIVFGSNSSKILSNSFGFNLSSDFIFPVLLSFITLLIPTILNSLSKSKLKPVFFWSSKLYFESNALIPPSRFTTFSNAL